MPVFPNLSERFDGPEAMDRPDCDPAYLYRTLAQFRWVNLAVSRYRYLLKRWVVADMSQDRSRAYHLVDLGAGGCDIPAWLLGYCRGRGLKLRVTAVDTDARTVAWARGRYGRMPGLDIVRGSAFEVGDFGDVDYVYSNHLLHHFPEVDIVRLFGWIQAASGRGFLVCDLRRSRLSYLGFSLLGRALLRESFAFEDGQVSIRKGFTQGEFQRLVNDSGIGEQSRVFRVFPGRLVLVGGPAFREFWRD